MDSFNNLNWSSFTSPTHSHSHSLKTLQLLNGYNDFMESLNSVADFGSGPNGLDLEWWATRTTAEDKPKPLNLRCTAVDLVDTCHAAKKYHNANFMHHDLEKEFLDGISPFDVIWCHDTFQYLVNPYQALCNWRKVCSPSGMLAVIVPQTTNLEGTTRAYDLPDGHMYNWTMVSLIRMLALAGWDCKGGFFKKETNDPWLHAIVYNTNVEPMDPRTTSWYNLVEAKLLPDCMDVAIERFGKARERDLVLPWLDKSLSWLAKQ